MLNKYYACTLFDLGDSQSFMSTTFVRMCRLWIESMQKSVAMSLPTREVVIVDPTRLKQY